MPKNASVRSPKRYATSTLFLAGGALLGTFALSGCTPAQAVCERARECQPDPPGEDFVAICQTRYDGQLNAYRANKEEECHVLADAKLALDACRAQIDDCDDFNDSDERGYDGNECEQEHDDYFDAFDDVEQECGTLD